MASNNQCELGIDDNDEHMNVGNNAHDDFSYRPSREFTNSRINSSNQTSNLQDTY